MLTQAEAKAACSTVAYYEDLEEDAECSAPKAGLGTKLAGMFKRKTGALSKVSLHNTFATTTNQQSRNVMERVPVCMYWEIISTGTTWLQDFSIN